MTSAADQLIQGLEGACRHAGSGSPALVAVTATAAHVALLGTGERARRDWGRHASDATLAHTTTAAVLEALADAAPFDAQLLDPLTDWLGDPVGAGRQALAGCHAVLAETDLPTLLDDPRVGRDLLGLVWGGMRARGDAARRGAFYTPSGVARLLAATMELPARGASVSDLACGTGTLALHVAHALRDAGCEPAMRRWHLADSDPVALALAGVNAVAAGLGPCVTLELGDVLAGV